MHVLLVDDDRDTRDMYTSYFSAQGMIVTPAVTGIQALNRALTTFPDVIVLDVVLPEMDGWETLRQLKLRLHTRKIPVVVLSGHTWGEDEVKASGCDRYVQKPCGPDELLGIVRALVPPRT
jgi:DNA-binding response OmpR family regulator